MNFGSFQGTRVLDVDTVKEIRRDQVPDVVSWLQGLIWYGDTSWGFLTLGHTGGDFGETTRMFFRPDRRVGVVTLTNSYLNNQNWRAFSDIERRLFEVFSSRSRENRVRSEGVGDGTPARVSRRARCRTMDTRRSSARRPR
jgi:hypothetical protein